MNNRHAKILKQALKRIAPLTPLTPKIYENLSFEDFCIFELISARFARLYDYINYKEFPLLLKKIGASKPNQSSINQLKQLEELNFLKSANEWLEWRKLARVAFFELSIETEKNVSDLNKIIKASPVLLTYWEELSKKIEILKEKTEAR